MASPLRSIAALLVIGLMLLPGLPVGGAVEARGEGPAFNSVPKIPLIRPERDYLPANYSHIMNMVFQFPNVTSLDGRETGVSVTLVNGTLVRVYGFNGYSHELAVADVDLVTLEARVLGVFMQYFDSRPDYRGGDTVVVNGTRYHVLNHFAGSRPMVIASEQRGGALTLATYVSSHVIHALNITDGGGVVRLTRSAGLIVVTRLSNGTASTLYLDLGAVPDRPGGDQLNSLPADVPGYWIAHATLEGGVLRVAETSLGWPGAFLADGVYLDYVNGEAHSASEWLVNGTWPRLLTGVVVARADLDAMNGSAAFIYAPGYDRFARGLVTSDGGYLALLLGRDSVLVVRLNGSLGIEWATSLSLPLKYVGHEYAYTYYYRARMAEAGDGYALLLPVGEGTVRPALIYLSRDGSLRWAALMQPHSNTVLSAELSATGDTIYVEWHGYNISLGETHAYITMFDTNGTVLGSFRNPDFIDENAGMFSEAHGRLGRDTALLLRRDGYAYGGGRHNRLGYMDAAYLNPDYRAMELGHQSPFRSFHSNEQDLQQGEGWLVESAPGWVNASSAEEAVRVARYKPLLAPAGSQLEMAGYTLTYAAIHTMVRPPESIRFTPSFYYPVAILPSDIDFGEVHVGEEKVVEVEIILLTQAPETTDVLIYHRIETDDPSFWLDKDFYDMLSEWNKQNGTDVGRRLRFHIHFKPAEPGTRTATFGLGMAPRGCHGTGMLETFDWPRHLVPIRGVGVDRLEPITSGDFPAKIGLSVSSISMPPFILPGSTYRESIYFTNVGNAEMVFLEGIIVLPGSSVVRVEGADQVISVPGEGLEPFFVVALRILPGETRRVDLYMTLNASIADPGSPLHLLARPRVPHGAVAGEVAALPPAWWENITAGHNESTLYRAVDEAMNESLLYLAQQVSLIYRNRTSSEILGLYEGLARENPVLFDYIYYMLVDKALLLNDEIFLRWNDTAPLDLSKASPAGIIVPLYSVTLNNTTLLLPTLPREGEPPRTLLLDAPGGEWRPSFVWYMRELFKPREFAATAAQGLIGFAKGAASALTFGAAEFTHYVEPANDYQAVGKVIGETATNLILLLAGTAPGEALEAAGVRAAKYLSGITSRAAGEAMGYGSFRFALMYEMGEASRFKTLAGIERIMTVDGQEVYGTLVKFSFNERFAHQGWYIGIGYVREATPVTIAETGKTILPTKFHWYLRPDKLAIHMGGRFVDITHVGVGSFRMSLTTARRITTGLLTSINNLRIYNELHGLPSDFWEALADYPYGAAAAIFPYMPTLFLLYNWLAYNRLLGSLGTVSFSADPNYLALNTTYLTSPGQQLAATVHFENLPNATAPAHNITITISITGPIDPSTIEAWDASHPSRLTQVSVEPGPSGATVTIRLEGVDLPPNKNPPEGEGWITIRMKPLPTIAPGDTITVRASVVFDMNPPVETNTETATYDPDPPRLSLQASPPKPGALTVAATARDSLSGVNTTRLTILPLEGQAHPETIDNPPTTLNLTLQPGNYTLILQAADNAGNTATLTLNTTVPPPHQPPETTTTQQTPTGQEGATPSTTGTSTPPGSATPTPSGPSKAPILAAALALTLAAALLLAMRRRAEEGRS